MPPADPTSVCTAVLPQLKGGALLALSADETLLAAAAGATLQLFATQHLLGGNTSPLASLQLPAAARQVAWCPTADAAAPSYALLLENGAVLLGSAASAAAAAAGPAPLAPAAAGAAAAAAVSWSPDGGQLAVASGDEVRILSVPAPAGAGAGAAAEAAAGASAVASLRVASTEVQEGQRLEVDSAVWVAPSAILVSSRLLEGGEEESLAPLAVLGWPQGAAPSPDTLHVAGATRESSRCSPAAAACCQGTGAVAVLLLMRSFGADLSLPPCPRARPAPTEFFAPSTLPQAAAAGPSLRAAALPPWSAVVHAHRKAADDHVKARWAEGQCAVRWCISTEKREGTLDRAA